MARELSQEAVLDFLWGAGGSAPNAALLRHFQRFLRDPALPAAQRRQRRDDFKRLVNSLATVRPAAAPGASKDIVLRRRYRDLLGEEQLRPREREEREEQEPVPAMRPGHQEPPPSRCLPPPLSGPREPPPSQSLPPPSRSLPPPSGHQEPPPSRSLLPPSGHQEPPLSQSLPPPSQALLLLGPGPREPPPSRCLPPPSGPREPPPTQSLPKPSGPRKPPPSGPGGSPPSQHLPLPSRPKEPSPPQSLLPPPGRGGLPPSGTRALLPTGLPRSLPLSLAGPPPYRARPPPGPRGPPPSQCLLPPAGPGVLPCSGPPRSRCPPPPAGPGVLSPPGPLRSRSPLPAPAPEARGPPERSPPVTPPVFRSIRCQLALLEVQDIPSSLPEEAGGLPGTLPRKSPPGSLPGRGPSVPLGRREHAWLVAVSAGRWAQVRGLFLEEPQLALWRDFVSGFTALHWLAKHGDGQGLRELAAAAREAGLALDVDARSGCGYTPLHLAAMHGHQPAVKVLVLQLGCRVRVRDSSGRRPWQYLGSSTSGEIWQLLEAPRGKAIFPTQPLARSASSVSKASLPAGRTSLPACLLSQRGLRAVPRHPDSD
nr:ankyrin repeat domain-containing protein SOWAHB [Dromaius novaehollandiae]